MLIEIGVGIIFLGVGLFVGKMFFSSSEEGESNLLQRWLKRRREKKAKEKEFAARQEAMFEEARFEALKELKPNMVEYIKQQELDKLTGKSKTNKLQKFADAFSLKGTGIGSSDKINMMLGTGQNNNLPNQNTRQHQNTNPHQSNNLGGSSFMNDYKTPDINNLILDRSKQADNFTQEDIDYYLFTQKEKERKKHKARMLHEKTKQETKPVNKYEKELKFDFESRINDMLK